MKTKLAKVIIGILILAPFLVSSCLDSQTEDYPDFNEQLQKDLEAIDNYLATNNITAQQDPDGFIRYVIYRDSTTTPKPTIEDCATADYAGYLLSNGNKFDEGKNFAFPISGVIYGWRIGIPLLNRGDSAVLYIPSGLAYGYVGMEPEIPSNANLVFHVALKKIGTSYKQSDRSCN